MLCHERKIVDLARFVAAGIASSVRRAVVLGSVLGGVSGVGVGFSGCGALKVVGQFGGGHSAQGRHRVEGSEVDLDRPLWR
jgi:hypothetical protein